VISDSIDHRAFGFHIRPHLISFNYPGVRTQPFNLVHSANKTILILNRKKHWPQADLQGISTLVISNNFKLGDKDLERFPSLKLVVADGSNNNFIIKQLAELCSKFGIEFYSTREKGAFITGL
jgi:hypothetical protein